MAESEVPRKRLFPDSQDVRNWDQTDDPGGICS